jgi:putative MATE family efflux protein
MTRTATSAPAAPARYLSGSLFHHVFVMAGTGAIGLVAVFAVDLINLFYISLLGEKEIAAAVGFAGVVAFFHTSICIGLMIGITACVARAIGAGHMQDARRMATHSLVIMVAIAAVLGVGTVLILQTLLGALGATGEVARLAQRYLRVTMPSLPLVGLGMATSALLRSVGDARRSMWVTLGAAAVTACLDPLFIFVFGLGLDGAAIVSVIARCAMVGLGAFGVWRVHHMLGPVEWQHFSADARALSAIAAPAVLSNLATPVGAAFVTHSVAQFGPSAVAGQATVDRITPVAFGLIYSLSGAVGPILSQNLGARQFDRVRACMRAMPMVHGAGGGRRLVAAGAVARAADTRVFAGRCGSRNGARVLLLDMRQLSLCRSPVRGQRGIQQPGPPTVVYRLQLGTCHPGHHSLCLVGGALRTGAGDGGASCRAGDLRHPGDAYRPVADAARW